MGQGHSALCPHSATPLPATNKQTNKQTSKQKRSKESCKYHRGYIARTWQEQVLQPFLNLATLPSTLESHWGTVRGGGEAGEGGKTHCHHSHNLSERQYSRWQIGQHFPIGITWNSLGQFKGRQSWERSSHCGTRTPAIRLQEQRSQLRAGFTQVAPGRIKMLPFTTQSVGER